MKILLKIVCRLSIYFLLFFGISCTNTSFVRLDNSSTNYSPTKVENIKVYSTDKIDQKYEVLGVISCNSDTHYNSERPVNKMKQLAAKKGADAIINLRLEIKAGVLDGAAIEATGTAIKFTN